MDTGEIAYDYAEGQLLRLQDGRPDGEAYFLRKAPKEFLLEALKWNDPNGDYDNMTKADLLELVREQFDTKEQDRRDGVANRSRG